MNQKSETVKTDCMRSISSFQTTMNSGKVNDKTEKYITKTLSDYVEP